MYYWRLVYYYRQHSSRFYRQLALLPAAQPELLAPLKPLLLLLALLLLAVGLSLLGQGVEGVCFGAGAHAAVLKISPGSLPVVPRFVLGPHVRSGGHKRRHDHWGTNPRRAVLVLAPCSRTGR